MAKAYGHLKKYYSRYGRESGGGAFTLPQSSSIIINTPFNGSLTSTTGPDPTFARNLVRNYANTSRTLATAATQTPAFGATVFGTPDTNYTGIELTGETENLLTYSEDFTNVIWTAVGTGTTSSNTATDPFGTTLGDTISGSATDDGVEQITGYVTANGGWPLPTKAYLFSVFLKCTTGVQLAYLQVRDTVDSSLTKRQAVKLTTEWQRFAIYGNFPSTAAGFIACGVIVGNSNTCRGFGAQMQQAGNTGGSNMRARNAPGPYVTTTNTTKFSNTEILTYPFATVDNARSAGSVSFWVKPGRSYDDINEDNIISYFSLSGESFACYDSADTSVFYIGNVVTGGLGQGYRAGVWNHVCLSWDDATNSRRIVVNGQTHFDGTTAFTTWTAGSDLYIGQHSGQPQYWSCFAILRNFVMWSTQLSITEMKQIYNGEKLDFGYTYGTGLLFEVDLGVSIAPTTFSNQVGWYDGTLVQTSFAHTGNIIAQQPYFSDATTYAGFQTYDTPALPASPPLNTATNKGMQMSSNNKNFILRSCEPANAAWTLVGTAVAVDGVGNAFGANMPYGTIAGISGDGIKQSISLATADNAFVGSAWVKVAAGTLTGNITVRGDSGGSPQTTSTPFTATTTWQQIDVYKEFSGAGTGSCQLEVTLSQAGTLQISGLMLERRLGGQFCNTGAPQCFIKTVASTVEVLPGFLWYQAAGNFNPLQGTLVVWAWMDSDSADLLNSEGNTVFAFDGQQNYFVSQLHFVGDNLNFSFGAPSNTELTSLTGPVGVIKHRWHQYGVTWSANETGSFTNTIWLDGVQVATKTFTNGELPGWSKLLIGACSSSLLAADAWKGGHGQIRGWGEANGALISADFTANAAGYGR